MGLHSTFERGPQSFCDILRVAPMHTCLCSKSGLSELRCFDRNHAQKHENGLLVPNLSDVDELNSPGTKNTVQFQFNLDWLRMAFFAETGVDVQAERAMLIASRHENVRRNDAPNTLFLPLFCLDEIFDTSLHNSVKQEWCSAQHLADQIL